MGTRRKAREAALQFLFQEDFCGDREFSVDGLETRFEAFCEIYQVNRKAREYTLRILTSIMEHTEEIDCAIRESAKNWRLERISVADRNILRIAVCEIKFIDDLPTQVAINEAVEIAKRYGGDESPAFINGILDAVKSNGMN